MTTNTNAALRSAAESALEALEILDGIDTETESVTIHVSDEIAALRAALTAAAQPPEGWVMVPMEPTDAMVQASLHLDLSYMPGQDGVDRAAVYRAMLAAAPKAAPQPAAQQGDDFWPVDGNASCKQLIEQIGQMNFRLTALRQENSGLIARVKGQAEALRNYQSVAAPVAQGDGAEPVAYLWQHSETGRTRVVMPDAVITADASWRVIGPLFLAARSQAKDGGAE